MSSPPLAPQPSTTAPRKRAKRQKTNSQPGQDVLSSLPSILPATGSIPVQPAPSQSRKKRNEYQCFSKKELQVLLEWLTVEANFNRWKCAGKDDTGKPGSTSGETKTAIATAVSVHLATVCNTRIRDAKKIKDKFRNWETSYKAANDWLNNTGEGIKDPKLDRKGNLELPTIKEALLTRCKLFFELDPIFFSRPSIQPPCFRETGIAGDEPEALLFGKTADAPIDLDDSSRSSQNSEVYYIPGLPPVTANPQVEEDQRSHRDKRLDGDAPSSESDTDNPSKYTKEINGTEKGNKRKKVPGPPKQPPSFSETLLKLEESRVLRHGKDLEEARKQAEQRERLEKERLDLQREQLKGETEEREIRRMEAENRKMELRIKLKQLGLDGI